MEEADSKRSSRNPTPVMCILAKDIGDLAIKEKNLYSPILKTWHPLASGVAVATLHSCFGNELKQFIAGWKFYSPKREQNEKHDQYTNIQSDYEKKMFRSLNI